MTIRNTNKHTTFNEVHVACYSDISNAFDTHNYLRTMLYMRHNWDTKEKTNEWFMDNINPSFIWMGSPNRAPLMRELNQIALAAREENEARRKLANKNK